MQSQFKILFIFIMLFISGCSELKQSKVLLPASWLDMERIDKNIYVNNDMSNEQRKTLLAKIYPAKKRIKKIWGNVMSSPDIYACSTIKCYKNLGGVARAHQVFNSIVLSPKALTTEMISHEWSHSELAKRLDVTFGAREIPRWFDEGIAVIVSDDIRHNEQAWNEIIKRKLPYPQMDELITLQDWNKAYGKYQKNVDTEELVVIYATAGHAINQWYQQKNASDLTLIIEGVRNGNTFLELYNDTL